MRRSGCSAAATANLNRERDSQVFDPAAAADDQRKIASVLSAYDDLIENNRRRIKLLEEMAQRIYREWFVDFRYPGHEDVPLVRIGARADSRGLEHALGRC